MPLPEKKDTLKVLEKKSALLILAQLLKVEKIKTYTLLESLRSPDQKNIGNYTFYSTLNKLEEKKLVKSTQRAVRQTRYLELTELGKEVARKVLEIEQILIKAMNQDEKE